MRVPTAVVAISKIPVTDTLLEVAIEPVPLISRVPPLMKVGPVYVLVFPNSSLEVLSPPRMKLPNPLMTPENTSGTNWATVKVLLPKIIDPEPDKFLIEVARVAPLISKMPITETEIEEVIDPVPERNKVPASIDVAPVYVLTPLKVRELVLKDPRVKSP